MHMVCRGWMPCCGPHQALEGQPPTTTVAPHARVNVFVASHPPGQLPLLLSYRLSGQPAVALTLALYGVLIIALQAAPPPTPRP